MHTHTAHCVEDLCIALNLEESIKDQELDCDNGMCSCLHERGSQCMFMKCARVRGREMTYSGFGFDGGTMDAIRVILRFRTPPVIGVDGLSYLRISFRSLWFEIGFSNISLIVCSFVKIPSFVFNSPTFKSLPKNPFAPNAHWPRSNDRIVLCLIGFVSVLTIPSNTTWSVVLGVAPSWDCKILSSSIF